MYVRWLAAQASGDHLAFKPHSSHRADQSHEEQATSGVLGSSTVGAGPLEGGAGSIIGATAETAVVEAAAAALVTGATAEAAATGSVIGVIADSGAAAGAAAAGTAAAGTAATGPGI